MPSNLHKPIVLITGATGSIASAGFPIPLALAWIAAIFEIALALAFLRARASPTPRFLRRLT